MSARAIAIHGNEMSGERRANLEIKSECPALKEAHPNMGQSDIIGGGDNYVDSCFELCFFMNRSIDPSFTP